jgi:methylenetetrahydrofolate dehydrogenase (NADP+)/methenyltetrahydrofolate cyclohydrolase
VSARLIDGKAIATKIRTQAAEKLASQRSRGRTVCLAAVMLGDDPTAATYARSQAKDAESIGLNYRLVQLPATADAGQVTSMIDTLNRDASVHGIILQMPVPKGLDAFELQQRIAPEKDVEGVCAANLGMLAMGRARWAPCTAAAAFECLRETGINPAGKRAVVVGRSNIVGKPLAMLLINAHATVTVCHTRTANLAKETRRAEILVAAAGSAGLIGAEHVAPGAIVIDVGIHRVKVRDAAGVESTKTVGDVRIDEVAPIASHLTPVPGGVGPVTVAMLLANTVAAAAAI